MKSGIYIILNTETEQAYIGQSVNIWKRLNHHKYFLNKGIHPNTHLQRSFSKYGEDKFLFRQMEYCDPEIMVEKEQYWMDQFNSMNREFGFNLRPASQHASPSEETIEKMRKSNLGLKRSEEFKLRMKEAATGRKMSQEFKDKTSAYHKGRPKSEEHRAKLAASKIGKTRSEEDRKRMSEGRKAANAKRRMESL